MLPAARLSCTLRVRPLALAVSPEGIGNKGAQTSPAIGDRCRRVSKKAGSCVSPGHKPLPARRKDIQAGMRKARFAIDDIVPIAIAVTARSNATIQIVPALLESRIGGA